jgi:hypothetical protein
MSIDIIGAIYDPPAYEGGNPVRRYGWHVNVTPDVVARNPDLEARIVEVETLRQVWAGDNPSAPTETVPLRFAGEAVGLAALAALV